MVAGAEAWNALNIPNLADLLKVRKKVGYFFNSFILRTLFPQIDMNGVSSKPQRPLDIAKATGHGETLTVVQHNDMLALEHRLQFFHAV